MAYVMILKNLCNKDQFIWLMSDECDTGNFCKLFLQLFSTEKSIEFHWDCNRFTSYVNISYRLETYLFLCVYVLLYFFLLFFWYKILPLYAQKGSEFGKMKLSYFIWTCTYSWYVHMTMQEWNEIRVSVMYRLGIFLALAWQNIAAEL